MPVSWPDDVDDVLGGDLTAAVAYATPAGGAVVTAVAPIGLRDRAAGTVTFTTSLGWARSSSGSSAIRTSRSLSTLASTASRRARSTCSSRAGRSRELPPDRDYLETVVGPQAERFMGPPKEGRLFWDRWLQEYYADRVPVTVKVERIVVWPTRPARP